MEKSSLARRARALDKFHAIANVFRVRLASSCLSQFGNEKSDFLSAERCTVADFRHTIDRVSAVSSQSTPLARRFSPTFEMGCSTQIRTPARRAGGRGFESRRSRQLFDPNACSLLFTRRVIIAYVSRSPNRDEMATAQPAANVERVYLSLGAN